MIPLPAHATHVLCRFIDHEPVKRVYSKKKHTHTNARMFRHDIKKKLILAMHNDRLHKCDDFISDIRVPVYCKG